MYFDYKPVISINFCSFMSTSQKKKKKKRFWWFFHCVYVAMINVSVWPITRSVFFPKSKHNERRKSQQ